MRKTMLILLGLLLMAGAFGAFAYRYLGPSSIERVASRSSEDAGERGAERRSFSRPDAARGAGGRGERAGQRGGGWRTLDMTLNLLNLVVGVVGIWLTITGARMQRQAMAMHAEQQKMRSKM